MAPVLVTLSDLEGHFQVIPRLQAFSSAIRQTFVQYFTRFQMTARRTVPQRQLGFLLIVVLHVVANIFVVCTYEVKFFFNFRCTFSLTKMAW